MAHFVEVHNECERFENFQTSRRQSLTILTNFFHDVCLLHAVGLTQILTSMWVVRQIPSQLAENFTNQNISFSRSFVSSVLVSLNNVGKQFAPRLLLLKAVVEE